jgi:indole-3-glycerol phosphate synthase
MHTREGPLLGTNDWRPMPTQLEIIMAQTRVRLDQRRALTPFATLEERADLHQPRGFTAGLRHAATLGPAIIAELKKASPSKGLLRADYQPVPTAVGYEKAGAAAISVLTDEDFFQGRLEDLIDVSASVTIPVLRKDFILDDFQIVEARAAGADAILLIVAAHTDASLRGFQAEARRMGLDVLCEVHDEEELKRAIDLGCDVIGVNCRNLKTLEVDLTLHEKLAGSMPENAVRVAESGIGTPEDVRRLLGAGYDAFLIGEALMRHADPAVSLSLLLQAGR